MPARRAKVAIAQVAVDGSRDGPRQILVRRRRQRLEDLERETAELDRNRLVFD
jgi:hypothetical protein